MEFVIGSQKLFSSQGEILAHVFQGKVGVGAGVDADIAEAQQFAGRLQAAAPDHVPAGDGAEQFVDGDVIALLSYRGGVKEAGGACGSALRAA